MVTNRPWNLPQKPPTPRGETRAPHLQFFLTPRGLPRNLLEALTSANSNSRASSPPLTSHSLTALIALSTHHPPHLVRTQHPTSTTNSQGGTPRPQKAPRLQRLLRPQTTPRPRPKPRPQPQKAPKLLTALTTGPGQVYCVVQLTHPLSQQQATPVVSRSENPPCDALQLPLPAQHVGQTAHEKHAVCGLRSKVRRSCRLRRPRHPLPPLQRRSAPAQTTQQPSPTLHFPSRH